MASVFTEPLNATRSNGILARANITSAQQGTGVFIPARVGSYSDRSNVPASWFIPANALRVTETTQDIWLRLVSRTQVGFSYNITSYVFIEGVRNNIAIFSRFNNFIRRLNLSTLEQGSGGIYQEPASNNNLIENNFWVDSGNINIEIAIVNTSLISGLQNDGTFPDPTPPPSTEGTHNMYYLTHQIRERFSGLGGAYVPILESRLGRGAGQSSVLLYKPAPPPAITVFTATPSSVDLDTIGSGRITFNMTVSNYTSARIIDKGTGATLATFSNSQSGSVSFSTILDHPKQTKTYTLVAENADSASSQDVTVTVTQNPVLSQLNATFLSGGPAAPQGGSVRITGRVVGFPRPTITLNQNWIRSIHYTPVSGSQNTWSFVSTQFYGTIASHRTWVVTATNSSGSVNQSVILP